MGAACSEVLTKNRVGLRDNLEEESTYIPRSVSRVENWVRKRHSSSHSIALDSNQVILDVGIAVDTHCPDYYNGLFEPRISRAVKRGAVVMVTVKIRPIERSVSPSLVICRPAMYWGMLQVERQIPRKLPVRIEEEEFRIFGVLKPESQLHSDLQLHGYVDGELQLFSGFVDINLTIGEGIFGYMLQALERERAIEYIRLVSKQDHGRKSSRSTGRGSVTTVDSSGYLSDSSSAADPYYRGIRSSQAEGPDWLTDIPEEDDWIEKQRAARRSTASTSYPRVVVRSQPKQKKRKDTPAAKQPNHEELAASRRATRRIEEGSQEYLQFPLWEQSPSCLPGPAPWEKPALPTLKTIDTAKKGVRKKSRQVSGRAPSVQLPRRKKMSVIEEPGSLVSPRTNGDPSITEGLDEGNKHSNGDSSKTAVVVKKKRTLLRKDTPATIDVAGSRRGFLSQMHEDSACVEEGHSDEDQDQHYDELSEKVNKIPQKKIGACMKRTSDRGGIDPDMTLTETLSTYLPRARNSLKDVTDDRVTFKKEYPLENYKYPIERRNEGHVHAQTKTGTKVLTRKSTPANLPSVQRVNVAHKSGDVFVEGFEEEEEEEEEGVAEEDEVSLEGAVGGLH